MKNNVVLVPTRTKNGTHKNIFYISIFFLSKLPEEKVVVLPLEINQEKLELLRHVPRMDHITLISS